MAPRRPTPHTAWGQRPRGLSGPSISLPSLPVPVSVDFRDYTYSTSSPWGPFFLLTTQSVCTNSRKPCKRQPSFWSATLLTSSCTRGRETGDLKTLPGGTCASYRESVFGTTSVATQVLWRSSVTEPGKVCHQTRSRGPNTLSMSSVTQPPQIHFPDCLTCCVGSHPWPSPWAASHPFPNWLQLWEALCRAQG